MDIRELESGARTVAQVAVFFGELKVRAKELESRITPQERGYFRAAEEEESRALLVSYWQARNALFELITNYRTDVALDDEHRLQAFLVAFAAALVLVDAARFLRELVERRPIVRDKFNEPAAQFGVPAGVYDGIQRSLLSARHGWHLYYAWQYFQDQEPMLREHATDPLLAPLLPVIDDLRHRLDVSITQFATARLRTRTKQLAEHLTEALVGRALYGLQKLAGGLMAEKYLRYGHRPALPAEIVAAMQSLLHPGDVIIVRKEYALTNYFLPGYWPHAALYLGRTDELQRLGLHEREEVRPRWLKLLQQSTDLPQKVLESMRDGVNIRSLSSPLASDSVVVLRPRLDPALLPEALVRALSHEGKPYDFDFDFRRADRLVCTGVVYRAYDGLGGMEIPLVRRAGRPTLSGSDLIQLGIHGQQFAPVAVYASAFAPQIVTNAPRVADILRRAQGPVGQ